MVGQRRYADGRNIRYPVKRAALLFLILASLLCGQGNNSGGDLPLPATLAVTALSAANTAVTATLPAVAGQFHYITFIEIVKYAAAALTGAATPVTVTTTNLPGTPAFTFTTAGAIGTSERDIYNPNKAIKAAAVNTATTIVCPATTGVIWRVNVWYVAAP